MAQKKVKPVLLKPLYLSIIGGILLIVLVLISLELTGTTYFFHRNINASYPKQTTQQTDINFNPPTQQDKTINDQHKDELVKSQSATPTTYNGNKKQVKPTITHADKTTVNAYVTGVFEDGGTCTVTLTQGNQTITKTSTGFQNASYTQCTPISLTDAGLSEGVWTVIVSYSSSTAEGKSESTTLNI